MIANAGIQDATTRFARFAPLSTSLPARVTASSGHHGFDPRFRGDDTCWPGVMRQLFRRAQVAIDLR